MGRNAPIRKRVQVGTEQSISRDAHVLIEVKMPNKLQQATVTKRFDCSVFVRI